MHSWTYALYNAAIRSCKKNYSHWYNVDDNDEKTLIAVLPWGEYQRLDCECDIPSNSLLIHIRG